MKQKDMESLTKRGLDFADIRYCSLPSSLLHSFLSLLILTSLSNHSNCLSKKSIYISHSDPCFLTQLELWILRKLQENWSIDTFRTRSLSKGWYDASPVPKEWLRPHAPSRDQKGFEEMKPEEITALNSLSHNSSVMNMREGTNTASMQMKKNLPNACSAPSTSHEDGTRTKNATKILRTKINDEGKVHELLLTTKASKIM